MSALGDDLLSTMTSYLQLLLGQLGYVIDYWLTDLL